MSRRSGIVVYVQVHVQIVFSLEIIGDHLKNTVPDCDYTYLLSVLQIA